MNDLMRAGESLFSTLPRYVTPDTLAEAVLFQVYGFDQGVKLSFINE